MRPLWRITLVAMFVLLALKVLGIVSWPWVVILLPLAFAIYLLVIGIIAVLVVLLIGFLFRDWN